MKHRVLVTGATGFVGSAMLVRLLDEGYTTTAAVRGTASGVDARARIVAIPDLTESTDWTAALSEQSVVIHCAARVHVMNDGAEDPLLEYRRVNVEGTLALARQAAQAGVRRFVFLSSIKVNGESTLPGRPFTAFDQPRPVDPYGLSKLEAEQALAGLSEQTGMEVTIVRPPLVYGPGVKANFRSMLGWVRKGVPLPLGAIRNKRSMVALDNLIDLLVTCMKHPSAANRTFLVSDGEDLSTTDLLRRSAEALGRPARLIPVPEAWLVRAAHLVGKPAIAQRLCDSLQVDIADTRKTLAWAPPISVTEGLRRTVAAEWAGEAR